MKPSRYKHQKGKNKKASRASGGFAFTLRGGSKHKARPSQHHGRSASILWLVFLAFVLGAGSVLGYFAGEEIRTSKIQADYFSRVTKDIAFHMEPGPTPSFYAPTTGPYNQRLGYSYIPYFIKALESDHYNVAEQMRASDVYNDFLKQGLHPIYRPKTEAGLMLKDRRGEVLYSAKLPNHVFKDFDSIPKLLVDTLLFIEDRDLLADGPVTRNPAIEWDRFFYAAFGQFLKIFIPEINLGGGSTLATQIEKFRFSPGGQTSGIEEKLVQIISASMRVYMDGPDTRETRKRIVLDYLNSTPLSARAGFGEINSIGDGMWAWFGRDIDQISLGLNASENDPESLRYKGTVYREILGLMLAQRRPSFYLLSDRNALDDLTDQTLDNLAQAGVISPALREATRSANFRFLPEPPALPAVSFLEQKATNAIRAHMLKMMGLRNMYELDRVDLSVTSTLDQSVQRDLVAFLKKMDDPAHVHSIGLYGFRLLTPENDVSKIKWSVLLYEKGKDGNKLRIQADNIDAPLDMNEGGKLDLGSTAKLRTLITYLEIIGELYRRYAGLSVEDLVELTKEAPDVLTSWATTWLADHPDASVDDMLQAAMDRKYSGNPGETFFTGGGAHTFVNFDKAEDYRTIDLREAMRDSVNLVFIRLIRDVVNYIIAQGQQTRQELLSDPDHPARKEYLERYADKEASSFLNKYIGEYANLDRRDIVKKVTGRAHKGSTSRAILFRYIDPEATIGEFSAYMRQFVSVDLDKAKIKKLYDEYPANRYNLSDAGYITGVNPLELWLVSYKLANPGAGRQKILSVSKNIRIESYAWLFHPNKKGAQDTRIRILLELDAFARIQQRWARLGYPFDKLVPSFATAIGSSADRPGALAELVGILLNDGVRKPMLRFESIHFAQGTPYETLLTPNGRRAVRVLDPAIARVARAAMIEVVEDGTARRLRGAYQDEKGQPLVIGGKTGTGDHRFDEFAPGGRLISSRVVNRTGTIMFFIGDRFFGTVTAHVGGQQAGDYKFTSALSAQMLKSLAPILQPLIAKPKLPEEEGPDPEPIPEGQQPTLSQPAAEVPPLAPPAVEEKAAQKPKASKPRRETPATSNDLMMDILPR